MCNLEVSRSRSLRQWMSQFGELDFRTKKVSRESSSKPWESGVELYGGQSARGPRFSDSPLGQSWANMTNSYSLAFSFSRFLGEPCCSDDKGSLCPGYKTFDGFQLSYMSVFPPQSTARFQGSPMSLVTVVG